MYLWIYPIKYFKVIDYRTTKSIISIFYFRRFVYCFAIRLGNTIATGPIRLMIFQLQNNIMILVAKQTAVLANPFRLTCFTIVKVDYSGSIPVVRKAINIHFNRNSFNFNRFSCQLSYPRINAGFLSVYEKLVRQFTFNPHIHFGTNRFHVWEYWGKLSQRRNFYCSFVDLLCWKDYF